MFNKDYERETNIPDFVEDKDEKDPDLSVFSFDETQNTQSMDLDDEDYEDDEYETEDRPRHKLSAKGILIIGGVICAVLLIATIAGWIYGIGQNNKFNTANEQLTQVQNELSSVKNELSSANSKIADYEAQIAKLNPSATDGSIAGTYTTIYKVNVRNTPSTSGDITTTLEENSSVNVTGIAAFETFANEDDVIVWAVTDQGYYFAIVVDGELTVKKAQ